MGVKAQPRALLAKMPGVAARGDGRVRDVLRLRRHVRGQVRRDLGAPRRQQVPAHRRRSGADAVVLGDLGCMLNIEGRLRRRGDATTRCCTSPKCSPASCAERTVECRGSHASRVDALQGARARQAARRAAAAATCSKIKGKFVAKRASRARRARRLRRHARRGARRSASARSTTSTSGSRSSSANATRARRDGAVRADAGRSQRARARDRAPARRAQDHQVEVDGLRGVGARPRDRGRRA